MKRNIILAILFLATIAFSCTPKEEFVPSDKALTGDGSIVYNPTATIESFILDEPATKTVLAIDDNTGATFTFAEGDKLGVFPYSPEVGNQVSFEVKNVSETSCTFNGGGFGLKEDQLYAAYYPYDKNNSPDNPSEEELRNAIQSIPVDYTKQRQETAGAFNISATDYLVANGISPSNGACNFNMSHVGALVVIDVTLQGQGYAKYTELSLNIPVASFVKTGTIDLTASNTVISEPDKGKSITLALGEGTKGLALTAGQTHRFCMMVAPVDLKTGSVPVTLSLKDKEGNSHTATLAGKNFRAGYAYKYACTITAAAAEPDPVPTNLSANGTANCYIVDVDNVNEAGYYFDCTVAGNGQTVDMAGKSFNTHANVWPQVNGTYSANLPVLHATDIRVTLNQNSCISNVTIDPTAGIISFKASGAKGNAKILVMDAANDDPAWVWHIWCTDQPAVVSVSGWSSWGYSYDVMDRNIGAIRATFDDPTNANNPVDEICGFYYQFGNPTGWTWAEYSNGVAGCWRMVDGIAGAEKYHKPYLTNGGNVNGGDFYWFDGSGSSAPKQLFGILWGGGSAGDGSLKRGPSAVKTMYDPCPPGYKVMPIDGYDSVSASDSADQYGFYKSNVYIPYSGAAWNGGNFWMHRGYVPNGDTGNYACLWTSGHNNTNMSYFLSIYSKDVNRAGGGTVTDMILARGMCVRCVKE